MNAWTYYNHAMIPTGAPYEEINMEQLDSPTFWKENKTVLFARWITDFDCGCKTNWWYVIKDTTFDIHALKAKRRYEINKGIKNFDVRMIDPCDYAEELYGVQAAAFSAYPKKYRPTVDKENFMNGIYNWSECTVYGAFFKETGRMVGYAMLTELNPHFVNFNVLKTNPEFEKYGLNAAIIEKILSHHCGFLEHGGIICDGSRSINHETHFQDYLEKYFGFRKAYCCLHIRYNPKIEWLVKLLFHFRKLLKKLDGIGIVHQINGVLKMEEICRENVSIDL